MTTYHTAAGPTIIHRNCMAALARMATDSVDAIVTDPPYGLGFMGKAWDDLPPGLDFAREALRVLKPGGHMLAFGGTRTWHRLAVAVEDAGFEIRDTIAWLYGSGFPKSLDVSKAIDKAAGAEREIVGPYVRLGDKKAYAVNSTSAVEFNNATTKGDITAPATPEAAQWSGWGTALKPAFEPVVVARKPLVGTVAANVLEHGTGALNIDGCRIEASGRPLRESRSEASVSTFGDGLNGSRAIGATDLGRWPANVVLDADQAAALDEQSGTIKPSFRQGDRTLKDSHNAIYGKFPNREDGRRETGAGYGDSGGASRFFYVAKAPKRERPVVNGVAHPTVKPLALMRWLVRLVTPPGGTVLDPFAGSGTTVEAAVLEGFNVIGIEREADYLPLIEKRIRRSAVHTLEATP